MKIAAFSDWHGSDDLPQIEEGTDIVCIAGDICPGKLQYHVLACHEWFKKEFLDWVKGLNVKMVFLVAGNHDFLFERFTRETFEEDIREAGLSQKVKYLCDDEYEYEGYHIYGTPWIKNLDQWAFNDNYPRHRYEAIPEHCDILITHMPPVVDKVGTSQPSLKGKDIDYGSLELEGVLKERHVKVHFCGHVHTGTHFGVELKTNSDTVTKVYNVSMVDEKYRSVYPVTYVELKEDEQNEVENEE